MGDSETVFVCVACGKRSHDQYGRNPIDRLWDASCSLNCVEAKTSHLVIGESGRVTEIEDGGIVSTCGNDG